MYQKVKAYMKEHGMVVDGDVVLAGVSGGGDSMAMLEMLKRYQAEATFFAVCGTCASWNPRRGS